MNACVVSWTTQATRPVSHSGSCFFGRISETSPRSDRDRAMQGRIMTCKNKSHSMDKEVLSAIEAASQVDDEGIQIAFLLTFLVKMNCEGNSMFENILKRYRKKPKSFRIMTKTIVEEATKQQSNRIWYQQVMYEMWIKYLAEAKYDSHGLPTNEEIDRLVSRALEEHGDNGRDFVEISLLQAMSQLSATATARVMIEIKETAHLYRVNTSALTIFTEAANTQLVNLRQAGVALAKEAIDIMRKWKHREISNRFAGKMIADVLLGVGGGACFGMVMGTMATSGKMTHVATGVGTLIGMYLMSSHFGWVTSKLFHVPTTLALEQAYRFLDVNHDSSNADINNAYRRKSLKWHPDKNCTEEANQNWHKLQLSMSVIRMARKPRTLEENEP